jgi:hypothetical protein
MAAARAAVIGKRCIDAKLLRTDVSYPHFGRAASDAAIFAQKAERSRTAAEMDLGGRSE